MLNVRKAFQFQYLILAGIIGLAFYIAFIPHQNYPYPLHVDEWVHLARSKALLETGSITFADPFGGGGIMGLGTNLEASFQLFWGVFQAISGISWMTIFRYFPGIIFIITVLSVYIMANRQGFGLEAAFFTLLIPTTVGILGPAFLVPVSLGLLFTPLILFLAFNFKSNWSYALIFVFICFLLAIHAPSAIAPIIVLAPYILLNLRGNFKHSLGLTLSLLLPFLIVFPWIIAMLLPTARGLFAQQPLTEYIQLPRVIQLYGYLPIAICLLGVLSLSLRGSRTNYGLVLGLLALLLMLVSFYSFHYGVPIVYERGLMYMMLMLGITAGAGLSEMRRLKLPERLNDRLRIPTITQHIGKFFCLAIAVTVLAITIPQRLGIPYYHMIDDEDYRAFVWIQENIDERHNKAILDPWKATAFTAITGKRVYTRIHTAPLEKDNLTYDFLKTGSSNTTFLWENDISIVYTRLYDGNQKTNLEFDSINHKLVKIERNFYLLHENKPRTLIHTLFPKIR